MKRLLIVIILITAAAMNAQAKYYSYKPANLKIDIPSGWGIQEVKDNVSFLKVTSPDKKVTIMLRYYNAVNFKGDDKVKYSWLQNETASIFMGYPIDFFTEYKETINGMKVYTVAGAYSDSDGNRVVVSCGAFNTGKQYSTLTIAIMPDMPEKYNKVIDNIIKSAKKLK